MIVMLELLVVGFVVLTVIYLLVAVYSRSVRREKLEKEFDADVPLGGGPGSRDAYVEQGMEAYEHGLRRKLLVLVYILPAIALAVIVYFVNFH
ncbi:MAG: hypothetical protein ABI832_09855 [bacterium]